MTTYERQKVSADGARREPTDGRALVMSAWTRLRRLFESEGCSEQLKPFEPMISRFELGVFRLVVMGEIKKGKSSFINALLGEPNLLPIDSDIATSTVYKVIYGRQRKFKVFFLPDVDTGKREQVREISESELADYGTENGNPGNQKRVDFIAVELPHPLLRQGLVLVDTPGVGGLHRAHRRISRQYAPNADAVFFVLDSVEAVISEDEISFLQDLFSNVTKRIFFVQTKIDAVDNQQSEAWQARNKEILREKLNIPPERLLYFPVSSKLKQIADRKHDGARLVQSGFLTLLDFLHRGLMQAKDRELCRDVARRLNALVLRQIRSTQEELNIFRQGSQEELQRLQQDYQKMRIELEHWRRSVFSAEMQRFSQQFEDLRRDTSRQIQDVFDPAGPMVSDTIRELKQSTKSPNELASSAQQIQEDWVANAADKVGGLLREFNQGYSHLLRETCKAMAVDNEPESTKNLVVQPHPVAGPLEAASLQEISTNMRVFESLRASLYGGMAGSMIANIAVLSASIVFPPVAAVGLLAALGGFLVGGHLGFKELRERKREEVLTRLQGAIRDLAHRCGRQFLNKFDEIARDYERLAQDSFKTEANRAQDTVQLRLKQLEEARSQTQEQARATASKLQQRLEELHEIERLLNAVRRKQSSPGSDNAYGSVRS